MSKLFFIFLFVTPVFASSITLQDRSITDDEMAERISYPRPPSISSVIKHINSRVDKDDVECLDLSHNNITLKGASNLFDYIREHLPNLRQLNLSYNHIRDWRGRGEYEDFETALKDLLANPNFEEINLKGTYLRLDWYRYIVNKFTDDEISKITIR